MPNAKRRRRQLDEEKKTRNIYVSTVVYAYRRDGRPAGAEQRAMIVGELRELFDRQPGNDVERGTVCLFLPLCVCVCVSVCLLVCLCVFLGGLESVS